MDKIKLASQVLEERLDILKEDIINEMIDKELLSERRFFDKQRYQCIMHWWSRLEKWKHWVLITFSTIVAVVGLSALGIAGLFGSASLLKRKTRRGNLIRLAELQCGILWIKREINRTDLSKDRKEYLQKKLGRFYRYRDHYERKINERIAKLKLGDYKKLASEVEKIYKEILAIVK
jgi:hypothetical protein